MTEGIKRTLELLVVEDNDAYLENAKSEVAKLQTADVSINVSYARNYSEFETAIRSGTYNGIVSDIFFPESAVTRSSKETLEKCDSMMKYLESDRFDSLKKLYHKYKGAGESINQFLEKNKRVLDNSSMQYYEYSKWLRGESLAPLGILVLDKAKQDNIPIVLCTSTYHHGHATGPIYRFAGKQGVLLVDAYPGRENEFTAEATEKDWKKAFQRILFEINGK